MRRNVLKFAALLSAVTLLSCSKTEIFEEFGMPVSFVVSHEDNSSQKASLSGTAVNWDSKDTIVILTQKTSAISALSGTQHSMIRNSDSGASATFSGSVKPGVEGSYKDYYFAVYPYCKIPYLRDTDKDAEDGNKTKLCLFYCPMGSVQRAVKDNFSRMASVDADYDGLKSAAMYGATEVSSSGTQQLKMKNAYSIIKFKIGGSDITGVDFSMGGNTLAAQNCAVKPTEAPFGWTTYTVTPWSGRANSKTLRVIPEQGRTTFEPGTYYVSCVPVSGKPTVYVHKKGSIAKLVGNDAVKLERNTILPIGVSTPVDQIAGISFKSVADSVISLDFTASCPFTGFPTSATAASKKFTYGGKSFTFAGNSTSTYHYDSKAKCLNLSITKGNYLYILFPVVDGMRISKFEVTETSSAKTYFALGSNTGSAISFTSAVHTSTDADETIAADCLYSTPGSEWYLKPQNVSANHSIKKIMVTYSAE